LFLRVCSNAKFQSFLKAALSHGDFRGQDLGSLLILPIQRLPRYGLLLSSLLELTDDPAHADRTGLLEASRMVGEVTHFVNDQVRRAQQLDLQRQLTDRFVHDKKLAASGLLSSGAAFVGAGPGPSGTAVAVPNASGAIPASALANAASGSLHERRLVRRGELIKRSRRGPLRYEFFLFDDMCVYASAVGFGKRYKLHNILPVNEAFDAYDITEGMHSGTQRSGAAALLACCADSSCGAGDVKTTKRAIAQQQADEKLAVKALMAATPKHLRGFSMLPPGAVVSTTAASAEGSGTGDSTGGDDDDTCGLDGAVLTEAEVLEARAHSHSHLVSAMVTEHALVHGDRDLHMDGASIRERAFQVTSSVKSFVAVAADRADKNAWIAAIRQVKDNAMAAKARMIATVSAAAGVAPPKPKPDGASGALSPRSAGRPVPAAGGSAGTGAASASPLAAAAAVVASGAHIDMIAAHQKPKGLPREPSKARLTGAGSSASAAAAASPPAAVPLAGAGLGARAVAGRRPPSMKPIFQPNDAVRSCPFCDVGFGLLVRRHHCKKWYATRARAVSLLIACCVVPCDFAVALWCATGAL
jgi:hypothetical protein